MKNIFCILFIVVFCSLLIAGCGAQARPVDTPILALKPTVTFQVTTTLIATLKPTSIVHPTATFLPTFTYGPSFNFPTPTASPLPKDVFNGFQELSRSCKVKTAFGVVSPGEVVEEQVLRDETIQQIRFSLFGKSDELDLALVQPDGTVIDQAITNSYAMEFTSEPAYKEYFVREPYQSGIWIAKITNKSASSVESAYKFEVSAFDLTNISIDFDKKEYVSGERIVLSVDMGDWDPEADRFHDVVIKVTAEDPLLNRYSFNLYDNGTHGDAKAKDGVYSNIFDKTSSAGIYKFHLKLAGLNDRAEEPFARECFIAKSVNPVPAPTATISPNVVSNSCKKIEASEPVIVRAEDEGGNDSSEYSRVAFSPRGVSTSAGILVTWRVGFDGQSPEPNAYMRLLDANSNPIGDVKILFERNWLAQSYSLVKAGDNAVLTYCGRYKYEDKVTAAFLDPYGHLISERPLSPTNRFCGRGEAIWTGSRMLFAWAGGPDYSALLDIADANGNTLSWKAVRSDSGLPRLAIGHGRVLMVVPTKTEILAVHNFDLDGNELGEPVILEQLTHEINGQIVTGYFRSPYIVPTVNGWMILTSLYPSGIYIAHLAPDGTLISAPFVTNTELYFTNGFDDVLSYEGGAVILGENTVLFLSDSGVITQRWYPKQDEKPYAGSLFEHQGRLFLVYTSEFKGKIR
jgi:hypothetical protein